MAGRARLQSCRNGRSTPPSLWLYGTGLECGRGIAGVDRGCTGTPPDATAVCSCCPEQGERNCAYNNTESDEPQDRDQRVAARMGIRTSRSFAKRDQSAAIAWVCCSNCPRSCVSGLFQPRWYRQTRLPTQNEPRSAAPEIRPTRVTRDPRGPSQPAHELPAFIVRVSSPRLRCILY